MKIWAAINRRTGKNIPYICQSYQSIVIIMFSLSPFSFFYEMMILEDNAQ